MTDAILAFDDHVGGGEARRKIALVDRDGLECDRRRGGVVVRRGRAVLDLNVGGEQTIAILVSEQQNGLRDVTDLARGKARLVVVDQRDDVPAGDVAVIDDREAGRVEVRDGC